MRLHRLESVDGFIAFDLDDAPTSAGGTRYASDVTEREAALLARAMTYKFGVLERPIGGAKAAVRGRPDEKDLVMRRYCDEIAPLVRSGVFLTGPDLGTCEADFASLRDPSAPRSIMAASIGQTPVEDLVTGYGVVVAAEAAMGSLEGLAFAVEGFGKVGGGVAREAVRRGARIVAVSTIDGCVFDPSGLDVELLLSARQAHGDPFVVRSGLPATADPSALFDVDADVLVPGARVGVITREIAARLRTRWIVPAANVPYAADAIATMRERRIRYLPDFVCNSGATIGYTSGAHDVGALFGHVAGVIERRISDAAAYPEGLYEGACANAQRYIATWRGADRVPPPPLS